MKEVRKGYLKHTLYFKSVLENLIFSLDLNETYNTQILRII